MDGVTVWTYDAGNLDGWAHDAPGAFFTSDAFFEKKFVGSRAITCVPWSTLLLLSIGDGAAIPSDNLNIIGGASACAGSIGFRAVSFVERALS
jgi:hypothetical protein